MLLVARLLLQRPFNDYLAPKSLLDLLSSHIRPYYPSDIPQVQLLFVSIMSQNSMLLSHDDWFDWALLMRNSISPRHLWETYVNNKSSEAPEFPLPIPDKPLLNDFRTAEQVQQNVNITLRTVGMLAPDQLRAYQVTKHEYNLLEKERQEVITALEGIHCLMLRSVKTSAIKFLHENRSPAALFRALKAEYCPTNEVWIDKTRKSYRDHCENGPTNGYTVDEWLTKLLELNKYAVALGMPEAVEMKRDFRRAQTALDPSWATVLMTEPYKRKSFPDILNKTRHHYMQEDVTKFPTPNSFATLHGKPSMREANAPSSRAKSPKCVCGGFHRYAQCWHLNPQAVNRPVDFRSGGNVRARIEEALMNPRVRQGVDKAISTHTMLTGIERPTAEPSFEDAFPHANMAIPHSFQAYQSMSPLKTSWIVDTGSEWHICNDKNRYLSSQPYHGPDVLTGDGKTVCKETGKAYVRVEMPDRIINRVFPNVKYIPGFHTNILSAAFLENGRVYLNTRVPQLEDDRGRCIAKLARYGGLYLLENNTVHNFAASSKVPSVLDGSPSIWHRRLAHASHKAVKHLPITASNITISGSDAGDMDGKCDVCELAKYQRQISRVTPSRSASPFATVHIDLIVVSHPAYNGHKYVFHAVCDHCRYHFVRTGATKTILDTATRELVNLVKTRYNARVQQVHGDQDPVTSSRSFQCFQREKGFRFTASVPYTPEQNGKAERAGRQLSQVARTLHIDSHLPQNLWPELYTAATHILNMTPTRVLSWKAPQQLLTQHLGHVSPPSASHFRLIGSKAFTRRSNIPNGHKLAPRAAIGWLVGYEASNIWRIWISDLERVIRARDVIFDESVQFRPSMQTHKIDVQHVARIADSIHIPCKTADASTSTLPIEYFDEIPQPSSSQSPAVSSPASAYRASSPSMSTPPQTLSPVLPTAPVRSRRTPSESPEENQFHLPSPAPTLGSSFTSAMTIRQRSPVNSDPLMMTDADSQFAHVFAAFSEATREVIPRHQSDLPAPPQNWHELKTHPYGKDFREAADMEYREISRRDTWCPVTPKPGMHVLPVLWVLTYKFDDHGYLRKFKARLCVQGNRQPVDSITNTRATTLAAKRFRFLMALTAAFD